MMTKDRIAVAMSGGVDSSVVAAMLKNQGHSLIGVTMVIAGSIDNQRNATMIRDAKGVADFLNIEHHVIDLKESFANFVIKPFLTEYTIGRTPNPCVICNYNIKFGKLLEAVLAKGYQKLATGHYVRQMYDEQSKLHKIYRGYDNTKDQSYMMYTLNQGKLAHTVFPLGSYKKSQIRELAKTLQLPVAHKPESQDICFIDNNDYKTFWQEHSSSAGVPGLVIDPDGNVLGEHNGIHNYTIGQRRGLGVALGYPAYVVNIDPKKHTVTLGPNNLLLVEGLTARNVNWLAGQAPDSEDIEVKIRYSGKPQGARIKKIADDIITIKFSKPIRAVTPGQSAVFYSGDELLGGGVIEKSI